MQAAAAGKYFSTTEFTAIYASPLLRAYQTAEAVRDASQHPPLSIIQNPKLREQHFGIAEGNPWESGVPQATYSSLEDLYAQGIFPVLTGRDEHFPEGESLNDLAKRAEEAIHECVLPHLQGENQGGHILLASHGLCISELVAALVRLDPDVEPGVDYRGLMNTAWTRAVVSLKDSSKPFDVSKPSPLNVKITDFNASTHLEDVGVIPVKTVDAKQAFFAGKADAALASAAGEKL
ncbi:phosphoglycerate mutase-like protein [Marasmius fiardii PR-910]|nr:phosphoglycerate mutase-like protein [Marasmius fiardii PR-910]